MEFVAPLINSVVKVLFARVTKEVGYWRKSGENVEAMNVEITRLKTAAKRIEKQKEDVNDVKGIDLSTHVLTWLDDVKKINSEAERIPTDGIGMGCFNIRRRYKAGKDSSDILEKMKKVKDIPHYEATGEIILSKVPSTYIASTSGTVDDGTQIGFETRAVIFTKALECLEPKNIKTRMIALSGMGGVGKSLMMERLKNEVEKSGMFYWVVKVVVGQNTGLIALQHALAEKTGGALIETTCDARAERLKNRFTEMSKDGEKKILVILDDVWEVLNLEDIGLTSSLLSNGFKLLITSRYADVCAQMGADTDSVFKIGALNDDEAETLFYQTVGISKEGLDHDLDRIGDEIMKWCGNLPIALKTIASTLKGKKESAWKETRSRLQHHDLREHYEIVHNVFKISYNFLKTKDEKALFLLCGLFPDDFDIPVEELIRYGWGLKLFSKVSTLAKARLRVETCIESLINANLLAESDRVGCVVMHDLARAFALSDSTEVKQASIVNNDDVSQYLTEEENESYQRILLKFTDISLFPREFNCPNLTFFKLTGGVDQLNFPDSFYKNIEKLEVLSYEDLLHPPLPPRSSHCSTHLRTLCLHGCELISDHWSAIEYLVNLEALSFVDSRIEELPSVIGKLKKLKLLDLTGCRDLRIDDGVFRDLDKLEELYMRVSGQKAIQFTNANCDELEKLSMKFSALEIEFFYNKAQPKNISFKNLERFKISIGCLLNDDKLIYSYQNTLKLVTNSNDLRNCKINELFKKTEELHLEVGNMMHLQNVLMHPPEESFSRLRVLVVEWCNDLRYLFTVAMASALRKLERLKVCGCPVLESLVHDGVIKFPELKFLSLEKLPELGSLCDTSNFVELPQLMELKLDYLPKFELLPLYNKQIDDDSMHPSQDLFLELRVLAVTNCKKLRYLFPVAMATGLRKLERLEVYDCDVLESLIHGDETQNDGVIVFQELKFLSLERLQKLGSLCDIDKVVKLPQLVELKLNGLLMFTSIYPDNGMHPFFNKQVEIPPKLEILNISKMKNLKQIWPSEITTSGEVVQSSMVRVVQVYYCNSLVNLFPCNPMFLLCNLEKLQVSECSFIEVLFNIDLGRAGKIEEVSSSLRSIDVENLNALREVWRIKGVANNSQVSGFKAVENISIHNCENFRNVFTPANTNFDMKARAHLDINYGDSNVSLFNKALESLQTHNKSRKIALCGMGSVGKTRMMEDLVQVVEDLGMFDLVLKLFVGREANVMALQQATAECIDEDLTETDEETRAEILNKRFMQISQEGKKNILVILDDLWKVLDLKGIGLWNSPLLDDFKLLITSRDENVCAQMGVERSSIFRVSFRSYAELKTDFFETLGVSKDEDPDLYKMGEEIIMSCGNFHISVEIIASVLKSKIKDKSKWEEVLTRLQNHELEDIYDVLKIAFEMSYNLKTDEEKAILFLFGLFPRFSYTNVEELLRYAWGLRLFPKEYTCLAQARQWIKASIDVLIHANFLTRGYTKGPFKMRDEVRGLILGNFRKVKQAIFDHGNMAEVADESYERISLNCTGTSEFPIALNYPNLKLLEVTGDAIPNGKKHVLKFPQDFYDRMGNLEVVAHKRINYPLLPSNSANLRALCLYSCSLADDFSFLGDLINLEILSFAESDIQKLPSTIGNLINLKLLEVTGYSNSLSIEDGVFKNLVSLEELYLRCNPIRLTDANYEEMEILLRKLYALEVDFCEKKLNRKAGSFEKLEKFRITLGLVSAHKILFDSFENSFGNTLVLVGNCSEVVESKMNELYEKTERLYLEVKDMKNVEDVLMHNYSFRNLRELKVNGCKDLRFLFTVEVANGLMNLERLNISSCPVLKTMIHGESMIMFPKLKSMYFRNLPRLTSLCDTDNRVEVQSLFNPQVQLPKLEELRLEFMENLKQIWPYEYTNTATVSDHHEEETTYNNNISMLRRIIVRRCDSLVNLFPCNPLPLVNHLEELSVADCCSIQVLFNMDLSRGAGAGSINEHRSSLRKIEVASLENLREIWKIRGGSIINNSSSDLPIRCFQAVEVIEINKCKRYRDIFAPKNSKVDIRALVTIESDD